MRVFLRCDGNPHETDLGDMPAMPSVGDEIILAASHGVPEFVFAVRSRTFERRALSALPNVTSDLPPLPVPPAWVCVLTWKMGP